MTTPTNPNLPPDEPVRAHTYDGIQEYDKRLPNWWLLTFYAMIAFAIVYWFYYSHANIVPSDGARLDAELQRIQEAKLASGAVALDDETLWKMSRESSTVGAGHETFKSTCMSCHGEALTGGIGPSLVDQTWVIGGRPTEIQQIVTNGTAKGMPSWGPVLGAKKITEVVAFILSRQPAADSGGGGTGGQPSSP